MRKFKKASAILLAATLVASSMVMPVTKAESSVSSATQEYIVLTKNDKGYDKVEDNFDVNEELSEGLEEDNIVVASMTAREAKKLERDKNILLVEEDITLEGSDYEEIQPDDFSGDDALDGLFANFDSENYVNDIEPEDQWNIDVINANFDEYSETSGRVKTAILDSGVTASSDIEIKERINFIDGEDDVDPLYEDVSGHGTSIASIIGAKDNGYGITGVNPNAELYSLRVLDNKNRAPLSRIINGIYWCIDHDIDIINMSFGTTVKSEILEKAIKDADKAGILMIGAAGNNGETSNKVEYPAAFDEVIAVGASTPSGEVSDMSSTGTEVEIFAPGENIPATGYFDEIIKTDGTSMAAPHITGMASILLSKDTTKSSHFIRNLIKASSKKIEGGSYGIADLDYALSIYDDFAHAYSEDADDTNDIVDENPSPVDTFTDTEVEALWTGADHRSAIDLSTATTADVLKVFKVAQTKADSLPYLKGEANSPKQAFHGHRTYIATYLYLMRFARLYYNYGYNYAYNNTPYTNMETQTADGIAYGLLQLENDYASIFSSNGITNNQHNRARFIAGLAMHCAMDVYAHKAYYKNPDGSWAPKISGTSNEDITTFIPERYACAKECVLKVINVWHNANTPSANEFYLSNHTNGKFYLLKFNTFVSVNDPSTYNAHTVWFDHRTRP